MISSIHGEFTTASWWIVAASVFDMLDGRIARLAKATSSFGVEFDSMSDLVSFGVAPGILLYRWALEPFGRLGWLAAFAFIVGGALRLARFNVSTSVIPKGFFQGLPIPMAAGWVATFIVFTENMQWPISHHFVVVALTLLFAVLMVSTIRFPSFKELNWRSRASFGYLAIGVLCMILITVDPEVTLFLLISIYVLLSLAWNAVTYFRGDKFPIVDDASD